MVAGPYGEGAISGRVHNYVLNKKCVFEHFLQFFCRTRGKIETGGGRRSNEDQNACNAVMTALNSDKLPNKKLGQVFARHMKLSHCAIKRGRVMRTKMEDMEKKKWIRRPLAVPPNAIGVG